MLFIDIIEIIQFDINDKLLRCDPKVHRDRAITVGNTDSGH